MPRFLLNLNLWPLATAVMLGAVAGWCNLHTDEVWFVLLVVLVFGFGQGFAHPRGAWGWGMVIGACVPFTQWLALCYGWRTPYPNDLRGIGTAFGALVTAGFLAACFGAAMRGWTFPPSRESDRSV